MRRAFRAFALWALIATFCAAPALAIPARVVNRINAIGLVDYNSRPTFKVGDYARYEVTNSASGAGRAAYTLTVLIAGEEEFWGEKCFWIETWSDDPAGRTGSVASLMSYSIFEDSLADERIQLYRRKIVSGINDAGIPEEEITRGTANLNTVRSSPVRPLSSIAETLGVDTVQTAAGVFRATKVRIDQGKALTQTHGDSTVYLENRERRLRWRTPEVPITHLAREETRDTQGRRAWKLGYSSDAAPLMEQETSMTYARLVAFGHGETSRLLPPERRLSFEQQAARSRAAQAARRTGTAKRTASGVSR